MNGIIQWRFRLADYIASLYTGSPPVATTVVTLQSGIGSITATVRWLMPWDADTARLPTAASTGALPGGDHLRWDGVLSALAPDDAEDNGGTRMTNLRTRRFRVYIITHGAEQQSDRQTLAG